MKNIKNNVNFNSTILALNSSSPQQHTYITGAIDESSSTLLHRLHTNERQLRTLAVVLSLTGGLALSFALGVGIMIYWYCHKCKQKRRFDDEDNNHGRRRIFSNDNDSDDEDDEKSSAIHSSYSCNIRNCNYYNNSNNNDSHTITNKTEQQIVNNAINFSGSNSRNSSVSHHETTSGASNSEMVEQSMNNTASTTNDTAVAVVASSNSMNDIFLLPLPPVSHIATPEPSAPSAKELHFQQSSNNNTHSNSTSRHPDLDGEEELCHDCSIPPPAYTED